MHTVTRENNTLSQHAKNGRSSQQGQMNKTARENVSNDFTSDTAKTVVYVSKITQQVVAPQGTPTITHVQQTGAEAEAMKGINGNKVPEHVLDTTCVPAIVNRSTSAYSIDSCSGNWTTGSNSVRGSPNRVVRTVRTTVKSKRKDSLDRVGSSNDSPDISLDGKQMNIKHSVPIRTNTHETDQSKSDGGNDANAADIKESTSEGLVHDNHTKVKRLDENHSENKTLNQEQVTAVASHSGKNVDDVSDSLKIHIESLSKDNSNWYETLGTILKLVRKPTLEQQERIINHQLIELKFVNKLQIYLESINVQKLTEVTNTTHQAEQVWSTVKRFLTIVWLVSDRDVNYCQHILGSNLFAFLVEQLVELSANYTECDWSLFVIKAIIGILHNIARQVPNSKWTFRNKGLVTKLQTYIRSKIPMVKLKALIVLSYILSEAENEMINSDDDNFTFIFNVLSDALGSPNHRSSKYGMSVLEVLTGVDNLAINDENKIRIVRNGALGLYQEILEDGNPQETKQAIVTIWSLAFHHYNKQKMRAMPGIIQRLDELQQSPDEGICHAARGTFWELENTSKNAIGSKPASSSSSSTESEAGQPHIMISYQWDCQPIMLKIKDKLKHAGYKVWMDVEHMSGSTLEAMALAVEKAAVVLVCMSQKYKDSPNCRTEAEYVYRLRKDFVPLRMQQEYVPDGWLGILVGTRLYFDVHAEDALDSQIPRLIRELRDRGRISPTRDAPDTGVASLVPRRMFSREAVPIVQSTGTEVVNWDCQELLDWLSTAGVPEIHDRLADVDGALLLEMQKIQRQAPEYFYTMLRTELGLSTVQILKFSKSLRSLR